MFETQNPSEWLPERFQKWKPFFGSLLVTPFAFLIGASDFGPEGPHIFVGYVLFPYSLFLFIAGAFSNIIPLVYAALILLVIQFPIYGLLLSSTERFRRMLIAIGIVHLAAVMLLIIIAVALRIIYRP